VSHNINFLLEQYVKDASRRNWTTQKDGTSAGVHSDNVAGHTNEVTLSSPVSTETGDHLRVYHLDI